MSLEYGKDKITIKNMLKKTEIAYKDLRSVRIDNTGITFVGQDGEEITEKERLMDDKTYLYEAIRKYMNLCGEIPASVNIVLRAPAMNMADVFARIVEDEGGGMARYQQEGTVTLGDARKLNVPYPFYQELIEKDVFQRNFDRQMLLIHGDCDTVVLPDDTAAFCARNPQITREIIHGADHLFLHAGELDQVMALAVPWLMRTASGI